MNIDLMVGSGRGIKGAARFRVLPLTTYVPQRNCVYYRGAQACHRSMHAQSCLACLKNVYLTPNRRSDCGVMSPVLPLSLRTRYVASSILVNGVHRRDEGQIAAMRGKRGTVVGRLLACR